ncbi:MAG: hypothetical protein OEW12_07860 [Deltaproteobacteria bacterium]|nr:hypothetical protein [Deltaproteobacteria bacterium]
MKMLEPKADNLLENNAALGWREEIPQGGDSPGGLVRPSGWLQFKTGAATGEQTLRNLETAVSLLQTASDGLLEIDKAVTAAIGVSQRHWLEGDRKLPPAPELKEDLARFAAQVDGVVRSCRFQGRGLLNGQSGLVGEGRGVEFIRGGPDTVSSPPEGYQVTIQSLPTRGFLMGAVPLDQDWIRAETEIFLAEGERFVRYRPEPDVSVEGFITGLRTALHTSGLNMEVGTTRQNRLLIRHAQYGSQPRFKGSSRMTPLLSKRPGRLEWNRRGRDVQGTIGGETAFGIGRVLMGYLDNKATAELAVAWKGGATQPTENLTCRVAQNAIAFHDGEDGGRAVARLALPSFHSSLLGRWVDTLTGYRCLADIRASTWDELLDTLYMLYSISGELEEWKERAAIWIERYQNRALAVLRRGMVTPEGKPSAGARFPQPSPDTPERMAGEIRNRMAP